MSCEKSQLVGVVCVYITVKTNEGSMKGCHTSYIMPYFMPPGRGPRGRFPGRRFHVAVSAKDVSQVAVKFIDVNDF